MSQCSDPSQLPKRSALIHVNEHDGCDSVVLLEWNSQTIDDGDSLKSTLTDLLTEWFMTGEGYDAFQEASGSFGFNNLDPDNDHLKPALEAQGIFNLRKRYISAPECHWESDDILFDVSRQDDFDKADDERNKDVDTSQDGGPT